MKLAHDYSTQKLSPKLLSELKQALKSVNSYGSVEVYIQDNTVTQITVRSIKKTHAQKLKGSKVS
jgi:hypothetical protein